MAHKEAILVETQRKNKALESEIAALAAVAQGRIADLEAIVGTDIAATVADLPAPKRIAILEGIARSTVKHVVAPPTAPVAAVAEQPPPPAQASGAADVDALRDRLAAGAITQDAYIGALRKMISG